MKLYFTDQTKHFERHLNRLKKTPVMKYDEKRLIEKVSTIEIDAESIDHQVLWDYNIFPSNILTHLAEWHLNNRAMKVGDTIVQQVFIPPTKWFSQKIVFGVRVSEVMDEPNRKGFSYETLDGHVERGISTFTLERSGQKTVFKIQTRSAPGNLLTQLLGPIFSRPYQAYSTGQALKNVKRQMENEVLAE